MKNVLTLVALWAMATSLFAQPCNTSDATGCGCPDGVSTTCDLIPDITLADDPLLVTGNNGVIEYSQSGNGTNNGRLRISVSTPNIGWGPLETRGTSIFICGTDTLTSDPGICPNTGDYPRQLVVQRIYRKVGNTMTYYDRPAGSMTYHASHGHQHIDDWGHYTLRIQDTLEPNPLNWPVVGTGAKLGFCLLDFGSCSTYGGHCEDNQGNIIYNSDVVNYGLGGGNYSCSNVVQGITTGYTDIYYQYLDGMWIDIPPGTCNGDYYIVVHVDPLDYFIEMDETNNVIAVPFTLTQQVPNGSVNPSIITSGPTTFCVGNDVTLTADASGSYLWSNGATTQSITVTQAGTYNVTVSNVCGSGSATAVNVSVTGQAPTAIGDTICEGSSATLSASGSGTLNWYDAPTGGNLLGSGSTFNTPNLNSPASYYVEDDLSVPGVIHHVGPIDNTIGSGGYHNFNNTYLVFDALSTFTLKSVKVYANGAGNRLITLWDAGGNVIMSQTVNIPDGESRVTLNWSISTGTNLRLGTSDAANMYRNSSGVNYPYSVANVASITSSRYGTNYYYYFYDWEVEEPPTTCVSPRTQVDVSMSQAPVTGIDPIGTLIDPYTSYIDLNGTPSGGTFSGPGVYGDRFFPGMAGIGGPYAIVYTVGNGNCTSSDTAWTSVAGSIDYCPASGLDASQEWIQKICVNSSCNNSGNDEGYGDYTNLNATMVLGRKYNVQLVPGYSGTAHSEYWRIWLDINKDNDFDDAGELLFDAGSPQSGTVNSNFRIPYFADSGWTRLRVQMKRGSSSDPCEYFTYGEIEDYQVYLEWNCVKPKLTNTVNITQTDATLTWNTTNADAYHVRIKKQGTSKWYNLNTADTFYVISGLLEPGATYQYKVRSKCGPTIRSEFTLLTSFTTLNSQATWRGDGFNGETGFSIYPNPATDQCKVLIREQIEGEASLMIFSVDGQLIMDRSINLDLTGQLFDLDISELAAGVYQVQLLSNSNRETIKLVVTE